MILERIVDSFRRWRDRSELRNTLCRMDDRQLADIGLTRSDIDAVVSGHYHRPPMHRA
jgi:uncharacterized protein YjiS (DUF1127 family)